MVVGTLDLLMPFTDARCMRITSRKGSRLMYQPGQAPPGIVWVSWVLPFASLRVAGRTNASVPTRDWTAEAAVPTWALRPTWAVVTPAPRFVSDKFFFTGSVAWTSGEHCSAMRLD